MTAAREGEGLVSGSAGQQLLIQTSVSRLPERMAAACGGQ